MCNEYLMTIYSPLESLTTDELNELMEELAQDDDDTSAE